MVVIKGTLQFEDASETSELCAADQFKHKAVIMCVLARYGIKYIEMYLNTNYKYLSPGQITLQM